MATATALGQTSAPSHEAVTPQPVITRTYPLRFDPAAFDVLQFASTADGQPAILASKKAAPILILDEFLGDRRTRVRASEQDGFTRTGASATGPTTLDRQGLYGDAPPQQIVSGNMTVTFFSDAERDIVPAGLFYDDCLDPAASYMQIRHGNMTTDKVLLYLFPHPVHLVARNRCEEDIFSPPHDKIRIIDPIMIANVKSDGSGLLAGGSYASMPVVISVPSGQEITGDGSSYFVVDKTAVDDAYFQAVADFEDEIRDNQPSAHPGADFAALVEKRLLSAIGKGHGK